MCAWAATPPYYDGTTWHHAAYIIAEQARYRDYRDVVIELTAEPFLRRV